MLTRRITIIANAVNVNARDRADQARDKPNTPPAIAKNNCGRKAKTVTAVIKTESKGPRFRTEL